MTHLANGIVDVYPESAGFNVSDGSGIPPGSVQKFGRNPDVDTGTAAEDIWDGGGTYLGFDLASEQPMEVVSDSTDDTAAGIGARTIVVIGLDENYIEDFEEVTLNGTTPVAMTKNFLRVFRAIVLTAGSSSVNEGVITISTTAAATPASIAMAIVLAGVGQTLMAIYTTPLERRLYFQRLYASLGKQAAGFATLYMQVKPFGGAWNTRFTFELNTQGTGAQTFILPRPIVVTGGSDIRFRVIEVSVNNISVSAGFDLLPFFGSKP